MQAQAPFRLLARALSIVLILLSAQICLAQNSRPRVLISVQPFEAIGADNALAGTVTELVRGELARSRRMTVLEETGRLYRMQRQSVRWREMFSEGSLRRLGELLDSRFTLTGSVAKPGEAIILSARIVDAESGAILAAETVEHSGGVSSISAAAATLARKVMAYFPLAGVVTAQRGDTLIADIGLDDGVLPGQELTVADLDTEERGITSGNSRSARYRVAAVHQNDCALLPMVRNVSNKLGVGATVVSPDMADELLADSRRTGPLTGIKTGDFGAVSITSEPPGALASVAGLDVGRTPVKVPQLAAGLHELSLALEGYQDVWDSILAVPGEVKEYHYEMQRGTGRLTIVISQEDVTLRVDTLELVLDGKATVTLEDFPEGQHHITARKQGFETWRETVDVDFRADSVLHIELKPYPGSVLVNSTPPGARLFLDGVCLGKTTPWRMVHLEPGKHLVRASITGMGNAVDTVEVVPGEDITIDMEIRRSWYGYEPAGMALVPDAAIELDGGDSAKVDSFYMDIHEVTNLQYSYFLEASERKAPRHWKNGAIPEGRENHPVVGISFDDAAAFAAWCGKRLPTELEWELASMGPAPRKYPWGDNSAPGMANTWSEGLGDTAPVGSYPEDVSEYGIYDMAGNAAEWVDAWSDREHTYRVFRGGSFYVNQEDPSLYSRDGHYPNSSNKYVGFRCARDLYIRR